MQAPSWSLRSLPTHLHAYLSYTSRGDSSALIVFYLTDTVVTTLTPLSYLHCGPIAYAEGALSPLSPDAYGRNSSGGINIVRALDISYPKGGIIKQAKYAKAAGQK